MIDGLVHGFAQELPEIDSAVLETVSRLIVAGRRFEQSAATMLRDFGFNYTDFDVLGMLRSAGPPFELSPAELLKFTMITSGAMTTCLDRLERSGMVRRRMSDVDRRGRIVTLTTKGKKVIEAALILRFESAGEHLRVLSEDDSRQLNTILRRLYAAWLKD